MRARFSLPERSIVSSTRFFFDYSHVSCKNLISFEIMASDGLRKRLLFSLRFASKEQEAGYLEFCRKDMLFSSRVWGACVLGAYVFFMIGRLINYTPWAETNEELRILNVTYMFLWSFGVCGGATLVGLPCLARFLSTSSCEILAVCAVCVALVPAAAANQQYMASFHGFELHELTCYPEADTFAILAVYVGLSSSYMVLAIRWSTLLPIGLYCLVMYTSVSFTFGHHARVSMFNSGMLVLLTSLLFVGKRRLEVAERRFFMMVISEKVLRAKAECQLAAFSTHRQSAPSVASDMLDTAQLTAQIDTIQAIGQREQWLLQEEELEVSGEKLGEGGFGVVLCGKFHGSPVAIKVQKMHREGSLAALGEELRIHRRLRHPNIVLFHGACVDEVTRDVALILEYCEGVSMKRFVASLTPGESDDARGQALIGVCRALRYLHSRCPLVVHGDLQHSNVMIESRALAHGGSFFHARLLDFGLSRVPGPSAKPLGGSMRWCAPEVFSQSVPPLPAADVYSFGLLIFYTATASLPYPKHSNVEVARMATRHTLPPLQWPLTSPFIRRCESLVASMIGPDYSARKGIVDVHRELLNIALNDEDPTDGSGTNESFWRAVEQSRQKSDRKDVAPPRQEKKGRRTSMSL